MRLWPFATFGLCAGLYLLTLTDVHTYDALSYILDVDRKPWPELFHPHHLAYGPLGALIRAGALATGWTGSVERLLQLANVLAGAAGVTLFAWLATREARLVGAGRGSPLAGGLAGALLATSYAWWYYAVEVEVYTIAALFLIAALALLLASARRATPALALALGVTQGLAVLFHQTNVLLCVPALVALNLGTTNARIPGEYANAEPTTNARIPGEYANAEPEPTTNARMRTATGNTRMRCLVLYLLSLGLVVGGAYLWVGIGVSGLRSLDELLAWARGYTATGRWGGALSGAKLAELGAGLANTVAQPGGALIGLGWLMLLLLRVRTLARLPSGLLAVTLVWLALYGVFFLWWEPANVEFWIAGLPPFYLLVTLAVVGKVGSEAERKAPQSWGRTASQWWPWAAITTLVASMLVINLVSIQQRGDAGRDLQRVASRSLAAHSAPGDLLLVPDGVIELYLPFYEGRNNVGSLSQAMAATAGDWPAACALLRERAELALASGYAVFVGGEARRPLPALPGEPPTAAEQFGLSADTVAACYEPLLPMMEPLALGAGLPAYERIVAAEELAGGPGWDFRRGRWGWRAAHAEPATDGAPGWSFRPGSDPALSSPPLRLELADYDAVELRLAAGTAARDAQLFLLDAAGQADEARSLRWQLQPGAAPQTYRLDLSALGWQGVIGGLRLDPVGAGDGATVTVEWIRLVRTTNARM